MDGRTDREGNRAVSLLSRINMISVHRDNQANAEDQSKQHILWTSANNLSYGQVL